MQLVPIILFAILGFGFAEAGQGLFGLGAGALIGYLMGRLQKLQWHLNRLEDQIALIAKKHSASSTTESVEQKVRRPVSLYEPEPTPLSAHERDSGAKIQATPDSVDSPKAARESGSDSISTRPDTVEPHIPESRNPLDRLFGAAKEWITTGNVPVKLGVIVSFFGVSFLLKYAVDREILVIPIEMRYLASAMGAGVLLAIGWRLRDKVRTYALSLQGGGIGILYLTIFAAFRLHPLLPAPFAFFLLVLLTASTGVLAVLQDARWLAILGVVGGFLAPVLVSTGSGNHVALFSYYLLLNVAILGIAWYKTWRDLNLIGFAFTFGVGTMWGLEYYRSELFSSTEPFLLAFFLFYQIIAILFALRQPPKLQGLVDGTLIFGTPVIAFALQARLVDHIQYGLATSAIVVAIFYTLVATWLHRNHRQALRLMVESFLALAIAFATIAIPLALDDRWTAVAWALEGAALVWVGVRQNGFLARLTGMALLGASGIAFMNDGWDRDAGLPLLNGNFLGGILISVASFFSSRKLSTDKNPVPFQTIGVTLLFLWGFGWWAFTGAAEILDRTEDENALHLLLGFTALSAGLLAWIAKHLDWSMARQATLSYLPLISVLGILGLAEFEHFFVGFGATAWILAMIVHFAVLKAYDDGRSKTEAGWHFSGALVITSMLAMELLWRMDQANAGFVWVISTTMLIPIAITLFIMHGRQRFVWPLQRYWSAYLSVATVLISLQLLTVGIAGLDSNGNPAPLPYVPIINPFDLLTIIGLAVAYQLTSVSRSTTGWMSGDGERGVLVVLATSAFLLSTMMVVRGVHNLGDIEWRQFGLMRSVAVQSALSIYWAILGLAGMVWGARHAKRWVWLAGTGLMALVVAKLFLIDLGNTGTVARIVSFLGVGAMLLVVGYFAPAPPRLATETEQ